MKSKLLLFAVATGLAIASASTFAAGTSSPFDAKFAAPLTSVTTYTADVIPAQVVEPSAIAIAGAKTDIKTIADAKGLSDPSWKTIAMTRGAFDDGSVTLKTALVDSSAQGGGGSGYATMTSVAGTGSSTAAPAIGYSVTDLAKLTKPDGSVTRVTT